MAETLLDLLKREYERLLASLPDDETRRQVLEQVRRNQELKRRNYRRAARRRRTV